MDGNEVDLRLVAALSVVHSQGDGVSTGLENRMSEGLRSPDVKGATGKKQVRDAIRANHQLIEEVDRIACADRGIEQLKSARGPAWMRIKLVVTCVLLPAPLETVSVTGVSSRSGIADRARVLCCGGGRRPPGNDQFQVVGVPVLRSLNVTQSESQPSVSDTEKERNGKGSRRFGQGEVVHCKEGSVPTPSLLFFNGIRSEGPGHSHRQVEALRYRLSRRLVRSGQVLVLQIDRLGPGSTTVAAVFHASVVVDACAVFDVLKEMLSPVRPSVLIAGDAARLSVVGSSPENAGPAL